VGSAEAAPQARPRQVPSSSVMRSTRVAVGFLLSVLPTPAVAVEGTYRDVGSRQRHPLHARPVPAWITVATVSRVGAKSFKVRVTTVRAGGCDGDVTAGGLLVGKSMTAVADGTECKLAIEFKGTVMDIREQGSRTSFRGLACHFGGSLTRVPTPRL
jgi:hypothetical protein